jgi:DnaJ-class molecular chaperone
VLGLAPNASAKEVKAQYYKLSLKHHPDRNMSTQTESEALFRQVNEAYMVLADGTKRAAYDATLGVHRPPSQAAMGSQYSSHRGHHGATSYGHMHSTGAGTAAGGFNFHNSPQGGFDQRTHYWEHYGRHFKERKRREQEHDELMRQSSSIFWPLVAMLVTSAMFVRFVMGNVESRSSRKE